MPIGFMTLADEMVPEIDTRPRGVQLAELADARQGIIYFLANCQIDKMPPSSASAHFDPLHAVKSLIGRVIGSDLLVDDILLIANKLLPLDQLSCPKIQAFLAAVGDKITHIQQMVHSFFEWVISNIAKLFGKFKESASDILHKLQAAALTKITNSILGFVIGHIPGISHVHSVTAIYDKFRIAIAETQHTLSYVFTAMQADIIDGHPSIIANNISARVAKSFCMTAMEYVHDVGMMLGKASFDHMTGGMGGTILDILKKVLMKVVAVVDRFVQKYVINKVLNEAREDWKMRESSCSMIFSQERFSSWYRKSIWLAPVVGSLSMHSGFAAHPYRFLQLLGNGQRHQQENFAGGLVYIDKLKSLSGDHIKTYSRKYNRRFISTDPVVHSRLDSMIFDQEPKTLHLDMKLTV